MRLRISDVLDLVTDMDTISIECSYYLAGSIRQERLDILNNMLELISKVKEGLPHFFEDLNEEELMKVVERMRTGEASKEEVLKIKKVLDQTASRLLVYIHKRRLEAIRLEMGYI